jgi:hypothetical protein
VLGGLLSSSRPFNPPVRESRRNGFPFGDRIAHAIAHQYCASCLAHQLEAKSDADWPRLAASGAIAGLAAFAFASWNAYSS